MGAFFCHHFNVWRLLKGDHNAPADPTYVLSKELSKTCCITLEWFYPLLEMDQKSGKEYWERDFLESCFLFRSLHRKNSWKDYNLIPHLEEEFTWPVWKCVIPSERLTKNWGLTHEKLKVETDWVYLQPW
jgi:hypothetical protein